MLHDYGATIENLEGILRFNKDLDRKDLIRVELGEKIWAGGSKMAATTIQYSMAMYRMASTITTTML